MESKEMQERIRQKKSVRAQICTRTNHDGIRTQRQHKLFVGIRLHKYA